MSDLLTSLCGDHRYAVILKERQEDEFALKETEKEIAKLTAEVCLPSGLDG